MTTTTDRRFEQWYPVAGSLTVLLAAVILREKLPVFGTTTQQLFASTVDVGAIAAGFLGTAKAMLLSFKGTSAGKFIEDSGLGELLSSYLRAGAWAAFGLAAVSLLSVGWIGAGGPAGTLPWPMVALWAGSATYTGLALLRAAKIFFKLFQTKK